MSQISSIFSHLEKSNEFLMDPGLAFPKVENSWNVGLIRNKAHSLQVQALQKLMELKADLGLPQNFRGVLEGQITRLNHLRERDKDELDRRMRDIRRVQKIIGDLEQHRQSYLSRVHLFGDADMTMDLAQREKHRNRLSEWEDEINFRNAMLEQLRLKGKSELSELNEAEHVLIDMLESQQNFRELASQELLHFHLSPCIEAQVIESSLSEGQVVFLQHSEWESLSSSFSMIMLRQLQHHFQPLGNLGYRLRSDCRYYSFLNDTWIMGDSEAEGLSFDNPSLQFAIKAEMLKSKEKEHYDQGQFLRTVAEQCVSYGRVCPLELSQWLKLSELMGQAIWPALVMFSAVVKTYQLEQRFFQIDRLMVMAKADGIVRREESELLKKIERQLLMPDARPPQLEKLIRRNSVLDLLPSKEELLEQVCRMAMCDDELHASEALCLRETLKDLGLDASILETHLKRQVS